MSNRLKIIEAIKFSSRDFEEEDISEIQEKIQEQVKLILVDPFNKNVSHEINIKVVAKHIVNEEEGEEWMEKAADQLERFKDEVDKDNAAKKLSEVMLEKGYVENAIKLAKKITDDNLRITILQNLSKGSDVTNTKDTKDAFIRNLLLWDWDSRVIPKKSNESNIDERVVVIGDIHSDFNSLKTIFRKLDLSEYDYFENATFVFLGDYVDRGSHDIQVLLFILQLKNILGSRCILQRGNHELIHFDKDEEIIKASFKPFGGIELFNENFDIDTKKAIVNIYNSLPYFLTVNVNNNKYLLVHGGIPSDLISENYMLSDFLNEHNILNELDDNMKQFLTSLLWTDPTDEIIETQPTNRTRVPFDKNRFENFMKKNSYNKIIRGHQEESEGYKYWYDNKLLTIFSTGGKNNIQTGYNDVDPCFAIINSNGSIHIESVYSIGLKIKGTKDNGKLNEKVS